MPMRPNRRGAMPRSPIHLPNAHRRYGKWTSGGLIAASEKIVHRPLFFEAPQHGKKRRTNRPIASALVENAIGILQSVALA